MNESHEPFGLSESWVGQVAGYTTDDTLSCTAETRRAERPSSLPRISLLVGEGSHGAAGQVAAQISDLGRVSLRRLDELPDLSVRPPSLAILVGKPTDLHGALADLSKLRSETDRPTPVLALGLADTEPDILRLLAAGANEVLGLPPRQGELRAKIRRLIQGTARVPTLSPSRGVRVADRYRIRTPLGSGAYGSVYDAWDEQVGRQVAVKVLPAAGPASRERFLREAYTLAAVRDRHLAAVFDVFEEEGHLFLVSEVVRGPTLRKLVLDHGALGPGDVLLMLRGLGRALVALERSGLLHRDIKPANVILRDGRLDDPVLVDFGLAKRPYDHAVSSAAFVMGTPGYMAPETVSGEPQHDGRADLFSLGMLARYALTGDEYMPDLVGVELVRHMVDHRVDLPPSGDRQLDALLLALTEPEPERRLASARDLLVILDAIATEEAA